MTLKIMKKGLIIILCFLLLLPFTMAKMEIIGTPSNSSIIELGAVSGGPCVGCNTTFNQSLSDLLYWRRDGTNAPPTSNWNMGDFGFTGLGDTYMNLGRVLYWGTGLQQIYGNGNYFISNLNETAKLDISSLGVLEIRTPNVPLPLITGDILIHSGNTEGSTSYGDINITSGNDVNIKTVGGKVILGATFPTEEKMIFFPSGNYVEITSTGILNLTGKNITANESEICTADNGVCPQGNMSFNESYTDTLYYPINNPNNYLNKTTNIVSNGGTGASAFNARGVIIGGITTVSPLQSIANSATAGVYLRGAGSTSNPIWSTMTLPNLCSTTNVPFCTATNTLGFGGTSTITFDNVGFQITARSPTLSLDDTNVGGVIWNITNNLNILTISSGSTEAFEINKLQTASLFVDKVCIGLSSCSLTPRGLDINGSLLVSYGGNATIGGLVGTGIRWVTVNASGGLRVQTSADNLTLNNLTTVGNVVVNGNFSAKRPYAMFSDNHTQSVASANTAYPINFSSTEDAYQITIASDRRNITVAQKGDYLIELSAIVTSNLPNKHVQIWIQKNAININRSNTKLELASSGVEQTLAVPFIIDLNTTDIFRVMWAVDDTGITMPYTTNTSYSPDTPSIIMTMTKISDETP